MNDKPPSDENNFPLQIFGQAKNQINSIFINVRNYVVNVCDKIIDGDAKYSDVINEYELKSLSDYISNVQGICEVLNRDHMKVAFFGRTSNGKSTVINAMLGENVLPSGLGHTTNCFLQVENSQTGDAYLVTEGINEKQSIESVRDLANALNHEKQLNEKELVHVYWPKDKCSLLKEDVILVDSPGVDVTPHLDDWIDAHCIDADVFVLVANAESTLMVTEKNFFHKVSKKLSKPNIFILNNRWDASANEPEFLDQVRKQHMKRASDFLVKELKVCTSEEATSRIFFISAKEVLQSRVQKATGLVPYSGTLTEGFNNRYMEFENFERRFEECISKSAIQTKFLNHSHQGKKLLEDIYNMMEIIFNRSREKIKLKMCQKKNLRDKLIITEQICNDITNHINMKIGKMVDDVENKVSTALRYEISRLSILVDEFNSPFYSNPEVLDEYKKKLNSYIETSFGKNVQDKLSDILAQEIDYKKEMIDNMSTILPEALRNLNETHFKHRQFELHCDNLFQGFHEQLEFPLSLSTLKTHALSLAQILMYPSNSQSISSSNESQNGNLTKTMIFFVLAAGYLGTVEDRCLEENMWIDVKRRLKSAVCSYLFILGSSCIIYGCLYLYDRLSWTTKAKEREFKRQYINYATRNYQLFVDRTSKNCKRQIQEELSSTFKTLNESVNKAIMDLIDGMNKIDCELNRLTQLTEISTFLKKEAVLLKEQFKKFDDTFLN